MLTLASFVLLAFAIPSSALASEGISERLGNMAVTDPFDGSADGVSNFSSETSWPVLSWASGSTPKGADASNGWHPTAAYPTANGAYFASAIGNGGLGLAAKATMASKPNAVGRSFSVWLDMNPETNRWGYQLKFTCTSNETNTYEVQLVRWINGSAAVLASKSGYSFAQGSSLALVDEGASVSAWTNTGTGFARIVSASDVTFNSGNTAVEGSGNATRLTNFAFGQLQEKGNIGSLPVVDSFSTAETPLSDGGLFRTLAWSYGGESGTGHVVEGGGWTSTFAYPTINGAYWWNYTDGRTGDTGSGDGVGATIKAGPGGSGHYFSLWLNMPKPASLRTGYQARFLETSPGKYEVTVSKWFAGTQTVLASQAGISIPPNSRVELVHQADQWVEVWASASEFFEPLVIEEDTSYMSGYFGLDAASNEVRLTDLRGGQLPPF